MIQHLTEIVEEARKRGKKRLAVAYGQDSHTLEAVYEAYKEGLVEPTLFGDKEVIKQVCEENDIDIKAFNIVDESNDVKCVQQAVASVVSGNADVLMKGLVSTDKYMRGILNKEAGLFPPKGVLSHVSIVEMPCYHKLLTISDVAVIPLPDFKQKMVQIGYLARTANLLGIETPKIACIAPSEQLLPNVISSTEGALLAKMADRGQLGKVVVDGPLSLDVALYKDVAEHKKVKGSSVAGDPDCLLFPNLESANVFFKSVTHLCGGELAAMVVADSVFRLQPGVLSCPEGYEDESYYSGLLEYPQYSRPEVWNGRRVPEILLSGHHAKIAEWRHEQSLERTKTRRPDLYQKYIERGGK